MSSNAGPLERAGIHLSEEDGQALKKNVDAMSAILGAIGTSSTTSSSIMAQYQQAMAQFRGEK